MTNLDMFIRQISQKTNRFYYVQVMLKLRPLMCGPGDEREDEVKRKTETTFVLLA